MGFTDWQVVLCGSWAYDFAYVVASGLDVADRRAWERDLLTGYLERLAACGAPVLDFDIAWLAYRQQALYPYFIWLSTIGHSVIQPKYQPDEVCLGIIERTATAVLDLDAAEAVEAAGRKDRRKPMRIVGNRCRTVEYTVTTPSPCAIDIERSVIGARRCFHDRLLVTIGVDRGDRALAGTVVRLVQRIVTESDAGPIVVEGFACLPRPHERNSTPAGFDALSELADALDVLAEVTERLEERGEHVMPFGWYKNCRVDPLDGIGTHYVIQMSADDNRPCEPVLRRYGPRSEFLAHKALAARVRNVCVTPERGRP